MTRIIDAEALKKALINAHINMVLTFDISTFNCVMNTIDNAPTVFDENAYSQGYKQGTCDSKNDRSTGKWIKIFENLYTNGYVCSICGYKIQVTEQFLPKVTECRGCGAEMKGGAE